MFKSVSFKKKNRYLLVCALILALVCYNFAIKKTIGLVRDVSDLKEKADVAKDAPKKIDDLKKKIAYIENEIGDRHLDSADIQQLILNMVTSYCLKNNLELLEFPKSTTYEDKAILVETFQFVIEGDFIKLLLLINQMEHHKEIGKITSTHFQSKNNLKTRKTELVVTVFIQNLKKIAS